MLILQIMIFKRKIFRDRQLTMTSLRLSAIRRNLSIRARNVWNTFEKIFGKSTRMAAHIVDEGSHEKPRCVKLNF